VFGNNGTNGKVGKRGTFGGVWEFGMRNLGFKGWRRGFGISEDLTSVCHYYLLFHLCHYYLCQLYSAILIGASESFTSAMFT